LHPSRLVAVLPAPPAPWREVEMGIPDRLAE
jgi:trimeric autotransporter adhesin